MITDIGIDNFETGPHKPLVTGSNPVAATTTPDPSAKKQGFPQNTKGWYSRREM
jgi:hypothetical protein